VEKVTRSTVRTRRDWGLVIVTENQRVFVDVAAVLLDLDGVLVPCDSTPAVERHWRAFAARRQVDAEGVLNAAHGSSRKVIGQFIGDRADVACHLAWFDQLEVDDTRDVTAPRFDADCSNWPGCASSRSS